MGWGVVVWVFFSHGGTWGSHMSIRQRFFGVHYYFHVHNILGLFTFCSFNYSAYQQLRFLFSFLVIPSDIMGLAMLQSFTKITLLYRISNKSSLINFAWSCVPFDIVKSLFSKIYLIFFWSFKISQFNFLLHGWRFYDASVISQLNYNISHSSPILQQSQLCSALEYETVIWKHNLCLVFLFDL